MEIVISSKVVKFSKRQAFECVLMMKQGYQPNPSEIDAMLLHFAPAIRRVAINEMEWVAKACAKNDPRGYLNFIQVYHGKAYGSDGHRVHAAIVGAKITDGCYDPKTLLRTDAALNTPFLMQLERMIIKVYAKNYMSKSLTHTPAGTNATKQGLIKQVSFGCQGYTYNEKYVLDAECNSVEVCEIDYMDTSTPRYVGKCKFGTFIVMSTRSNS